MAVTRKALNYDLDDALLRKHYPNPKSYKNAWGRVKHFLFKHGFDNRQYSGVVSLKPMTYEQAQAIVFQLNKEFGWLGPCVQKFDVTSVMDTYDLNFIFQTKKKINN